MYEEIRNYIKRTYGITDEELDQSPKHYIKLILQEVRRNNAILKQMHREKEEKIKDLRYLESSGVQGIAYDGACGGKNNGAKPNGVLENEWNILKLKETITQKIYDIQLLEKSLVDNNKLVEEFAMSCKNRSYGCVIVDKYIRILNDDTIAADYMYTLDWVRQAIFLGVNDLAKKIKH